MAVVKVYIIEPKSPELLEDLLAVPCVNAEQPWVDALADMVRQPALR